MNIIPFRGYRYNPEKVRNLDDVICPPYDQFKDGTDDLLYQRHPWNMAKLIMNKETTADTLQSNRYTRSKELLDQWLASQVFVQDLEPSVYPYFQSYQVEGIQKQRKGFVALGEVTDYAQKIVLPHERTLSKPKQDRLQLLRETRADTGLVFMLYSDPEGAIERILDMHTSGPPLEKALDLNQEENSLWRIEDPGVIQQIQGLLSSKTVIIADGHHRYEVARLFSQEVHAQATSDPRWDLYRFKLMSFVRLEATGITIFPIHRLVHSLRDFDATRLLNQMRQFFVVEEYPINGSDKFTTLDFLVHASRKQQASGSNCFVVYLPSLRRFVLSKLRPESEAAVEWPVDKSSDWRKLDVAILQVVILGHILGISDQKLAEQSHLEYVSHHADAIQITEVKNYQCAFLLNPTPIDQVKMVVESGDILPQKSTHFHPKLMEGLVFAKHL